MKDRRVSVLTRVSGKVDSFAEFSSSGLDMVINGTRRHALKGVNGGSHQVLSWP